MNEQTGRMAELIESGAAVLGIEFGSTRIKAALIAPDTTPLASGSYAWENQLRDGVWTYDMADVWKGLAACYASLVDDVRARYGDAAADRRRPGHQRDDARLRRPRRRRQPAGPVPHVAQQHHRRRVRRADAAPGLRGAAAVEHRPPVPVHPRRPAAPVAARPPQDAGGLRPLAAHRRARGGPGRGVRHVPHRPGRQGLGRRPDGDVRCADRTAEPRLGAARHPAAPSCPPERPPEPSPRTAPGCSIRRAGSQAGIPLCAPEGDAGTGMVATNAVRSRSGNVSAGTSIFAMIVLEQSLSRVHEEIDIVVTPDGSPVAMAHSNNGTSDLDAWVSLFGQVGKALGASVTPDELYGRLLPLAVARRPGCRRAARDQLRVGRAHDGLHRGAAAVREERGCQADPRELHARPVLRFAVLAAHGPRHPHRGGGRGHRGDPRSRRLLQGRRHRASG